QVHATLARSDGRSLEAAFTVECDYATGSMSSLPVGAVPAELQSSMPVLYSRAFAAFLFQPSRAAANFVVKYAEEGQFIRLDYNPREPAQAAFGHTDWHQRDGTPVKRRIELTDAQGKKTSFDAKLTTIEKEGRLLVTGCSTEETERPFSLTYEYAEADGFRV